MSETGASISIRTVKVSNVSLGATEQDIKEFFSFSGDIEYVEMQSENERSQIAYVTFKDSQGAETALLLSGATIVDLSVTIKPAVDYQLPPAASAPPAIRTVKVSNVSLGATEQDIKEFFSFSGDIEYVKMQSENERSQIAYVTFKDSQGAETALLLSGATIVDLSVTIKPAVDYQLPPAASAPPAAKEAKFGGGAETAVQKAEDVVSSMLAKGFILGKDALNRAKTFDEKHQLTSNATAKVASLDKKIGLSEKISMGTTAVNEKVKEMDQRFQVSEKTKSALAAAEQKVSSAGSAILKNRYVFTGASWAMGAFNKVAKAAGDVSTKAKEKIGKAEEEQRREVVDDFAQIHLSESPKAASREHPSKPSPAQGLIL